MEAQRQNTSISMGFSTVWRYRLYLGSLVYFKSRWNSGIETYAQYRKSSLYHIIRNISRYGKCLGINFKGNQGGVVPSEHPAREGEDA